MKVKNAQYFLKYVSFVFMKTENTASLWKEGREETDVADKMVYKVYL